MQQATKSARRRKIQAVPKRPQDYARAQFHIENEHVSDFAERATPEEREKANTGTSYGRIARRDLYRYYDLLRQELRGLDLTEDDALQIVELVQNDQAVHENPRLLASTAQSLSDASRIKRKLMAMTPAQAFAVVDAIERYLLLVDPRDRRAFGSRRERLLLVGLIQ
jgi:hypothetical protein